MSVHKRVVRVGGGGLQGPRGILIGPLPLSRIFRNLFVSYFGGSTNELGQTTVRLTPSPIALPPTRRESSGPKTDRPMTGRDGESKCVLLTLGRRGSRL